jgi:PhzF family phenazine biosynthesis protein
MRELDVFFYDSFTDHLFGGNVAGVILDAFDLPAGGMQCLATELAVPTTGFLVRADNAVFDVRFFTPLREIEMCGHVTIAVFAALVFAGRLHLDSAGVGRAAQRTAAGEIPIRVHKQGNDVVVAMTQNRPRFWDPQITPIEVARELGLAADDLALTEPFACASTGLRHLFVPVRSLDALRRMHPDFAAVATLSGQLGIETVGVYSREVERTGSSVHVRDLCPAIGNPEEPASGTTNGALASLLVREERVAVINGTAEVIAEQGFEMGRPSIIRSSIRMQGKEIVEVCVAGSAVCSMRGKIRVP